MFILELIFITILVCQISNYYSIFFLHNSTNFLLLSFSKFTFTSSLRSLLQFLYIWFVDGFIAMQRMIVIAAINLICEV